MSKFDSFYSAIRQYNSETTRSDIEINSLIASDKATNDDMREAADYLITSLQKTDPDDFLEFRVFRSDDPDYFRIDMLVTSGGPTVSLEYSSEYETLLFEYCSAYATVRAEITCDNSSAGGNFVADIRAYAY